MDKELQRLAELGNRRHELDQQIASLQSERETLDGQIREVAALVAGSSGAAKRPVVHEPDGIQPRMRDLLKMMRKRQISDAGQLSIDMYQADDETKRKGIGAYLSRLKASGHVESVEGQRGKFKLTELGLSATKGGA